jgi:gamma-glutamylcyclotransferase (GGCT)/AIG2-like uncharacterized protein YtfP
MDGRDKPDHDNVGIDGQSLKIREVGMTMNPHLFVYGSLMASAGHAMGERLRREARLLGAATIQGRLYKISWYPGAVASRDPGERVHGEVYALAQPSRALAWLDRYEGIAPGTTRYAEYERVEQPVRLASGEEIAAWVYLYRGDVAGLSTAPDGRWVAGGP